MHQLIKEEALRAALQRFYAAQSDSLPLTILRLMRFAFGWSSFAYTTITLPGPRPQRFGGKCAGARRGWGRPRRACRDVRK